MLRQIIHLDQRFSTWHLLISEEQDVMWFSAFKLIAYTCLNKCIVKECHSEDAQCAFVIEKIFKTASTISAAKVSYGNIAFFIGDRLKFLTVLFTEIHELFSLSHESSDVHWKIQPFYFPAL